MSSRINYTLTNFAEHSLKVSHDQLNRYLRADKLTHYAVPDFAGQISGGAGLRRLTKQLWQIQ